MAKARRLMLAVDVAVNVECSLWQGYDNQDVQDGKRIHILEESRFCGTRGIAGLTNYDPEKMRVNGSSVRVQTGV